MRKRKHITEYSLLLCSKSTLLIHPKDLDTIESQSPEDRHVAKQCHIYLILKRKRLSFAPGSIQLEDGTLSGKFRFSDRGNISETPFRISGITAIDDVELSDYPHAVLTLKKNDGSVHGSIPAHILSFKCHEIGEQSLRSLQVVYVGMAFGSGNRTAADRLKSHSTLQKILADINQTHPEDEALIVMAEYDEPRWLINMDGTDKSLELKKDRRVMSDIKTTRKKLSKKLRVSLIEAALIRYFQPIYNKNYARKFPSHSHKILAELYRADLGALTVELNTEDLNLATYSDLQGVGYHHIACYDLFDLERRRGFFDLGEIESGNQPKDMSGPTY